MVLKVIIQAIFCVQVITISAYGRDEAKEAASIILDTLKRLQENENDLTTIDIQPQFETNSMKDPHSNVIRAIYSIENSFLTNGDDMKAKRSWEDVSMIWRKSPKRAWEVVNRLWKNPEIRNKYKSYIENGKRSEELMENIPVQQNKESLLWTSGQSDNNRVLPVIESDFAKNDGWLPENNKRGWEVVHPSVWKIKKNTRKRTSNAASNKRGWEELNWKKFVRDVVIKRVPEEHGRLDYNFPKIEGLELINNQFIRPRLDVLDNSLPFLLKNKDTFRVGMNLKEENAEYLEDEKNSALDFSHVYDELGRSKDEFDHATLERLCRMVLNSLAKCRNSAKHDQLSEQ